MNNALSYIQSLRKRIKICSLSETVKSPLMWSHYANEHRGYAIRYKMDGTCISECKDCTSSSRMFCHRHNKPFFPVVYKDERYDVTHMALANAIEYKLQGKYNETALPFPMLTVLQKSLDWSYEQEWRIVCNNLERQYFSVKPDAIYLGELIDEKLACELAHIAKEQNIELYKMKIDYFSHAFNLTYDNCTNNSDDDIKALIHTDAPEFG